MLQSLEATIDRVGNIRLREGIELPANRRAIVVILPDEIDTVAKREFGAGEIEVHFRHPRSNKTLVADIKPAECTGQDALNSLLTADDGAKPFLAPASSGGHYELVVANTQQVLDPDKTFAEAGVRNGDTILIIQHVTGAGWDYSELGQFLVTSGLSLVFLKGVASVITQLIKSREKSFEYKHDGKTYKLTLNSSVQRFIELVEMLRDSGEVDLVASAKGNTRKNRQRVSANTADTKKRAQRRSKAQRQSAKKR